MRGPREKRICSNDYPGLFTTLQSDRAYLARVIVTDAAGNPGPPAKAEIDFWSDVD